MLWDNDLFQPAANAHRLGKGLRNCPLPENVSPHQHFRFIPAAKRAQGGRAGKTRIDLKKAKFPLAEPALYVHGTTPAERGRDGDAGAADMRESSQHALGDAAADDKLFPQFPAFRRICRFQAAAETRGKIPVQGDAPHQLSIHILQDAYRKLIVGSAHILLGYDFAMPHKKLGGKDAQFVLLAHDVHSG